MYKVGIDVGSTTIKCVVLDETHNIVYKSYRRHRAMIKEKVTELVQMIQNDILQGETASLALTGSASLGLAEYFKIPFVQEVVATQIAVEQYPETVDVVIELGGEDAKILFLTNGVEVRMNGTCAGGTVLLLIRWLFCWMFLWRKWINWLCRLSGFTLLRLVAVYLLRPMSSRC